MQSQIFPGFFLTMTTCGAYGPLRWSNDALSESCIMAVLKPHLEVVLEWSCEANTQACQL